MAILIDASVGILGYTTTQQLYIRMFYSHDIPGNKIHVSLEKYVNKQSYTHNVQNSLQIEDIPYQLDLPYNRSVDGIDTLGFVHQKVKEYLSSDQTQEVAQIDPSTGDVVNDPSTGDIIYDTVLIKNKFTESANISFVDLDPSVN